MGSEGLFYVGEGGLDLPMKILVGTQLSRA
jgi:hypothetical protein